MTHHISERAERELKEIYDRIALDNPGAAERLIETLLDAIEQQAVRFPRSGRPGRVKGTREIVRPPFVLAYRIEEDAIYALSVTDGRRIR